MILSYRWLSKVARVTLSPREMAEKLTMAGIEVEGLRDFGCVSGRFVAARVLKSEAHPRTPKLAVCDVDAGSHGTLQIVCGAPNVRKGLMGLLALEGAELPGGTVVARSQIQGVESAGMLCSGAEVKWNNDHDGILELPEDLAPGEPYDCLFEIKVTPNRADCLSVFGVARDLAALEGRELYAPQARLRETMEPISASAQVSVKDKKACARYACRLLRNVKVGDSPIWLQRALESCGLRPVNNIVDVTNYVLMEYGHPLHAFDLDKVINKHIVVRMAGEREPISLLDGRRIELTINDLVIADTDRPIALAGIMGAANSVITDATINVLIESAWFDPVTIRKTSKRHGISSDSSYRFERGADCRQALASLNRAAQLIAEVADAEIVKGVIDTSPSIDAPPPITMNVPRACMILGCGLKPGAIADRLVHLGFETVRSDSEQLIVRPPTFRCDVALDVDLIEEIARVHGYNAIPETTPYLPARPFIQPPQRVARRMMRRILTGAGFWEVMNLSFLGRDFLEKCRAPMDRLAEIVNPLSADQAVLRPSLLPGMLANVLTNQRRDVVNLRLFEMGRVFAKATGQEKGECEPYVETPCLGMVMTGQAQDRGWRGEQREADFFALKGAVELLLGALGAPAPAVQPSDAPFLHPRRGAELTVAGRLIGRMGELHPEVARAIDARGRIVVAELNIEAIEPLIRFDKKLAPIPRFPKVERDVALVVEQAVPAAGLEAAIREAAGELLEDVRLFDLYQGDRIEAGKKSLAYALSFRSPDRTLREEEIDALLQNVLARLEKDFGAVLRS